MDTSFVCVDQQGDVIYAACVKGDRPSDIREWNSIGDFHRYLLTSGTSPQEIIFTEETPAVVDQLKKLNPDIKLRSLPRLTAIYLTLEEEVKDDACLILSIAPDSAEVGYFRDGERLFQRPLTPISLREAWRKGLLDNDPYESPVNRKAATESQDDNFRDFLSALKGDQTQRSGRIFYLEPRYHVRYIEAISEAIDLILTGFEAPRRIVLSNWAAVGRLPEYLAKQGYNIHSVLYSPFHHAVNGLVKWGLNQQTSKDPSRLFKRSQEALSGGEYDKAIHCLEELQREDESSRLTQALLLLANIKHYKSVQGYEKKIAEARSWDELTQGEKPWVKEILTLAGREYLEKGDIESAEVNLERAYEIDSSGEVSVLLGKVKKEKGDQALRKGDLKLSQSCYKVAAIKDPTNRDYPEYVRRVERLLGDHTARMRKWRLAFVGAGLVALIVGVSLGRQGSQSVTDSSKEIGVLKTQVTKLETEVRAKDNEIESLKGQIQKQGVGGWEGSKEREEWNEKLERAGRLASIEREARMRADGQLAEARDTIASLEQKINKLEERSRAPLVPGRYTTIRDTYLMLEPRENSAMVRRIDRGIIVRVVEVVDGHWLRIISTYGNPPGYIRRDDAELLQPETGSR